MEKELEENSDKHRAGNSNSFMESKLKRSFQEGKDLAMSNTIQKLHMIKTEKHHSSKNTLSDF